MVSAVRVFVVDDNATFRRFVCSSLRKLIFADYCRGIQRLRFRKPGTATGSDSARYGATEAKQESKLPHQICRIVPAAIILFVSQISDADVVEEALSNGAKGYVLKQGRGQRARACSRSCSTWRALCQYRSCKIPRDIVLGPDAECFARSDVPLSVKTIAFTTEASCRSTRNSLSGTVNSVKPRFKHTASFEKHPDNGLVQALQSWEMDCNFAIKGALVFGRAFSDRP